MANSIGSLRLLGATHWPEFVETLSSVEQILRADPLGVYGRMDFGTRDTYRHAVERIARDSAASEEEVAEAALALAFEANRQEGSGDQRQEHVGYYLVGPGRTRTESRIAMRPAIAARVRGGLARHPLAWYAGSIVSLSLVLPAVVLWASEGASPASIHAQSGGWLGAAVHRGIVLLLLSTSQLALALVNWIVTLTVTPQALPRMDYSLRRDRAARVTHAGGGADAALQRARHRRAGRSAGGPLPGQPRPAPAVRAADRPARRARRAHARRAPARRSTRPPASTP